MAETTEVMDSKLTPPDPLGDFFKPASISAPGLSRRAGDLFRRYERWAKSDLEISAGSNSLANRRAGQKF